VRVLEDVREGAAAVVLADHVLRHQLLLLRARGEEGERIPQVFAELRHGLDCIVEA
jgi:hypothetical protein